MKTPTSLHWEKKPLKRAQDWRKEGGPCTYCGQSAFTMDHVIPYGYASRIPMKKRTIKVGKVVPACLKCNRCLGTVFLLTVEDRALYLIDHPKYGKTLTPEQRDWMKRVAMPERYLEDSIPL